MQSNDVGAGRGECKSRHLSDRFESISLDAMAEINCTAFSYLLLATSHLPSLQLLEATNSASPAPVHARVVNMSADVPQFFLTLILLCCHMSGQMYRSRVCHCPQARVLRQWKRSISSLLLVGSPTLFVSLLRSPSRGGASV